MENISFVLLVIALIAFAHVSEAQRTVVKSRAEVIKNDLHQAKDLIDEDLREKESNLRNLEVEVGKLTRSEIMLNELEDAYRSGKSLAPIGMRLKRFNRKIRKAPEEMKYVSIIQSILKDLGLNNGGRN